MPDSTAKNKSSQADASYKETVESILVAFILAFIFRAFVVEAFVIPTGSMAPTLYGAHMRMTCPDCGYTFDVGYSAGRNDAGDDIDIPGETPRPTNIRCPNCAFDMPTQDAGRPVQQPLRFGDRILVLKYLYLYEKPRRWDVVVFKSPDEQGHHVAEDPEYSVNYIKRLIGTPGDSIVILDGNVFIAPPGTKGIDADGQVASDAAKFEIQRKPSYVQERLWRNVYDNDFIPRTQASSRATTWHQPWQVSGGSGWDLGGGTSRVFRYDNSKAASTLFFNPNANRELDYLTDWISYNQRGSPDHPWVSDLKLSCTYTRASGQGPLRLYLTNSEHCFIAEISPGGVSLSEAKVIASSDENTGEGFQIGPETQINSARLADVGGTAPARIEFMNYDYQVVLRINGKDVFEPMKYTPDVKKLWKMAIDEKRDPFARPEIRISADSQACTIEHISLAHDIYYGNRNFNDPSSAFWASPKKVMHLNTNPAEYFVLGDNSLISGDARYWHDPVHLPREGIPDTDGGRVPEAFMLGKAFFVYWPAGYRLQYLPKNVVPDFGEMRFIH